MTRIIAVANQKGGVGKTTTSTNLAVGLVRLGKKVLLMDLDPQANATIGLGFNPYDKSPSVEDILFEDEGNPADVIRQIEGVDFIPAGDGLAGAERILGNQPAREYILGERIQLVSGNYDYVILDCPPSLGLISSMAFTAATDVLVILQTEYYSVHGVNQLIKVTDIIKKRLNGDLRITGFVCTMLDRRKELHKSVLLKMKQKFSDKVFKTIIRTNSKLAEAPSKKQSIFAYDPKGIGATDYLNLAKEVSSHE